MTALQQPSPTSGSSTGYSTRAGSIYSLNSKDWQDAFVDWAAWKWASSTPEQRQTFLGNTWNTSQYGTPDVSDTIITNPKTGAQEAAVSSQTYLALRRLASQYQGGDPEIDSAVGPWIPPKPGEYVEDPETATARIKVEQWEREFNRQLSNDERAAKINEERNAIAREEIAASERMNAADIGARLQIAGMQNAADIFGTQTRGLTDIYGTQGNIYGSQLGALTDIFGTQMSGYNNTIGQQANIYSTLAQYQANMESLKQQGLSDAAASAIAWQGLADSRVQNLISLKANPGNFVEAEYATRALQNPEGTTSPAYSDVYDIKGLIDKLANFQPGAAPSAPSWYGTAPTMPTAPTLPPAPTAPSLPSAPSSSGGTGTGAGTGGVGSGTGTGTSAPTPTPNSGNASPEAYGYSSSPQSYSPPPMNSTAFLPSLVSAPGTGGQYYTPSYLNGTISSAFASANEIDYAKRLQQQAQQNQSFYNTQAYANNPSLGDIPPFATGGVTTEPQILTGDVEQPGQPNPEIIDNPTGAPIGITNETNILEKLQELQQLLQQSQDPEEQQLIQEMISHYQDMLAEIQQGKTGDNQPMGQMPHFFGGWNNQIEGVGLGPNPNSNSGSSYSGSAGFGQQGPYFNTNNLGMGSIGYTGGGWNGHYGMLGGYNSQMLQPPATQPGLFSGYAPSAPTPNPPVNTAPQPAAPAPPPPVSMPIPGLTPQPFTPRQDVPSGPKPLIGPGGGGPPPFPVRDPKTGVVSIGGVPVPGTGFITPPTISSLAGTGPVAAPVNPGQYAGIKPKELSPTAPGTMANSGPTVTPGLVSSPGTNSNNSAPEAMTNSGAVTNTTPTPPPPPANPNLGSITSYPDQVYQNLPFLKYLQSGQLEPFRKLSTGSTPGAFGMQLPEAGALNYRQILNLANNPVSWQMADSAYKSGSRDLNTISSLVKSRAPLGSGRPTSIIRTR